jgi:hypothetical protein
MSTRVDATRHTARRKSKTTPSLTCRVLKTVSNDDTVTGTIGFYDTKRSREGEVLAFDDREIPMRRRAARVGQIIRPAAALKMLIRRIVDCPALLVSRPKGCCLSSR